MQTKEYLQTDLNGNPSFLSKAELDKVDKLHENTEFQKEISSPNVTNVLLLQSNNQHEKLCTTLSEGYVNLYEKKVGAGSFVVKK